MSGMTMPDRWLRHTIATLAYRAEKVLRDVPPTFGDFQASPMTRSPLALVAHLGDLMEWGARMARGQPGWHPIGQTSWSAAVARFFTALVDFDQAVVEGRSECLPHERIFQGPVADALTHVGQLAMMRGMIGIPVRPESYDTAAITIGRCGRDQEAARSEFDGDASPPV
jgi:hypothetical protein